MTDNKYQKLVKPGDQKKRPLRRGNTALEIIYKRKLIASRAKSKGKYIPGRGNS